MITIAVAARAPRGRAERILAGKEDGSSHRRRRCAPQPGRHRPTVHRRRPARDGHRPRHRGSRTCPGLRRTTSPSASAAPSRSTTSRSDGRRRGPSPASSARTARARPRCSTSSPGCCRPLRAGPLDDQDITAARPTSSGPAADWAGPSSASSCSRCSVGARQHPGRRRHPPELVAAQGRPSADGRRRPRPRRAHAASPTRGSPTLPTGQARLVELARALADRAVGPAPRRAGVGPDRAARPRRSASCCGARRRGPRASASSSTTCSLVMDVCDHIHVLDFGRDHRQRHAGTRSRPTEAVLDGLPRRGGARMSLPSTRCRAA